MPSIPQVAQQMQHVLGPGAEAAGRATGFIKRQRRLTGATFVQTLVVAWLHRPQASLAAICQTGTAVALEISPQGLDRRFTPEAAACLERVLATAVQAAITADPVAIPLLQRFPGGVWVQDSTVIGLPPALRAVWPGCGGSAGPTAALKLQVRYDLLTGALDGPLLHPGRAQDRRSAHPQPLPPGALRLRDLGYFSLAELRAGTEQETYWLSQVQAGTALFTADGRRWALRELLEHRATPAVDLPVTVGVTERLPARLLAVRVPQEVADQRRRRLTAAAQREGRAVGRDRLALCAWTVFITNVPAERLTVREAVVLARARWQVELLFKLWKSHNRVDEWRTANPWRILCEVYAKLIAVLIQHWLLLVGCWAYPDRSLPKAAQTVQAYALPLALALGRRRRLVAVLTGLARALRRGCRINKSAKRPHLYQLLLAAEAEAVTDEDTAAVGSPAPAVARPPAPRASGGGRLVA